MVKKSCRMALAGICAGAVNGLFGAGGGMVLVPLLTFTNLEEDEVFPASVSIILPICLVSLAITATPETIPWGITVPYLAASSIGGLLAGKYSKKIPTLWLHRALGALILWGGVRYLC